MATKFDHIYDDYMKRRKAALAMGGEAAIEKRKAKGQTNARERLDLLLDPHSFWEVGAFMKHRQSEFGMSKVYVPAEGVVAGYGKINGRNVVVISEDFTAMAGTFGEYHGKKFVWALEFAQNKGWPFIGINDSGGARLQEGMDTLEAYGWTFAAQCRASGIIPQIALLLGPCLGGQAYHPIMNDFLIQSAKTGFLGIAGPAFVKTMTGEEISLEDLSGWEPHAIKAGNTHVVGEDDFECIDMAKKLLSYMPNNNKEKPPVIKVGDDPMREIPELDDFLPDENLSTPYDMYPLIDMVVDKGSFFEIHKDFAPNLIVGFARFDGRSVGIVANNPDYLAGAMNCDSSDKLARFVRTCDLFNIPVVTFVDCPAFWIGSEEEHKGILRHGAKTLYAWADATVPLIAVIIGKSYAGAHYAILDKSIGADLCYAWPTAKINIVGGDTAASVIFAKEIKNSPNPAETAAKRINEYRTMYEHPYQPAERGYVDDVIMPHDTRKIVCQALEILENKITARPWRKYSNINL
ncbi:MAG: Propionyl-CoA carboxylase [Desulfotomaculum sp. 46_296]|nr:MAG: Propionyl-CoA carboxylase [Desulfotomaculum sp. 46_296]KUK84419.1 MAG: Propionyl-CoA carboxylase [Desulfofundulus kuznetsovii]